MKPKLVKKNQAGSGVSYKYTCTAVRFWSNRIWRFM